MIILPSQIGDIFLIHNGKDFVKLTITKDMVYHKLGEFANTRSTTKISSKKLSKKRKKKIIKSL
jgi:small subunit ribosomal protein S19